MNLNLTEQMKSILILFLMLVLPWIAIILGVLANIESWIYFILCITWFGSGIVFTAALNQ